MSTNFEEELIPRYDIVKVADLPDGSSEYERVEIMDDEKVVVDFNANLANYLDENTLKEIANELLEEIEEDKDSRRNWQQTYKDGLKLLGLNREVDEQADAGNDGQSTNRRKVYDTTLQRALLTFYSNVRNELFSEKRIATYKILTEKNEQLEKIAEDLARRFNEYLMERDKGYFPDSNKMIMPIGLAGTVFRKIYVDPIYREPRARFIHPENFFINDQCNSLSDSLRMTELVMLTKKEIITRINEGIFKEHEISDDGFITDKEGIVENAIKIIDGISDEYNHSLTYDYYESHAVLNHEKLLELEEYSPNFPLPYIVNISVEKREIVGIFRDWKENDPLYTKEKHYIQHDYFPGLGLYGYGLIHILGCNAEAQTQILNLLIESGEFATFQGGFYASGLRTEQDVIRIQPGQFSPLQTGQLPIRDAFATLPYHEPSQTLKELLLYLSEKSDQVGQTAVSKITENSNNSPVGTILALLERESKLSSAVMKSLYNSLGEELGLLFEKWIICEAERDPQINPESILTRFTMVPACDPSMDSSTQRIIKNEAVLSFAEKHPDLHDFRAIYKRIYASIGIDNIDEILLPEKNPLPLDPITENMNVFNGNPLKAAIWQDHQSHILTHQMFAQQNPDAGPIIDAHIKEHLSMQYFLDMQMQMGMQMPMDPHKLMDPEIQNSIAIKAAQVASQQQAEMEQQKPPSLEEVAMAEVEQKREAAHIKAEIDKMRIELESFKTSVNAEIEKAKLRSTEEREAEKNQTNLEIELLKHRTERVE